MRECWDVWRIGAEAERPESSLGVLVDRNRNARIVYPHSWRALGGEGKAVIQVGQSRSAASA